MAASPTSRPRTAAAIAIGLDGLFRAKLTARGRLAFSQGDVQSAGVAKRRLKCRKGARAALLLTRARSLRLEGRPTPACLGRFPVGA